MRLTSWFLTFLILFVAICFALHNGQDAAINLWPFGGETTLPLYGLALGTLFGGFFLGVTVSWLSHFPRWMETRKLRRDAAVLRQKLEEVRKIVPFMEKPARRAYMSWNRSKWRLGGKR
jgi:uncharacterized integral membrane protein